MADKFKACSVDGCNREAGRQGSNLKGMCYAHYTRWYKTGATNPSKPIRGRRHIQDWFDNFTPAETDECVVWPFYRMKSGYPGQGMHRRVCEVAHGSPPTPTHQAAHSCGNGHLGCINDRHLSWKTPKENMADQLVHGTSNLGSRNPRANLVESQVVEIKVQLKHGHKMKEIAARYGVSYCTIQFIKRGKNWKHV